MKKSCTCLITVVLVLIGLVSCAAETQTEPALTPVPSSTPAPKPSSTVAAAPTNTVAPTATPVPTEVPPTETTIPPIKVPPTLTPVPPTNTITAEPTVDLTENITYQEEDIVGTWIGEMPSWDTVVRLYFKEDGYTRAVTRSGATTELDKYYFEGEHLTIESDACTIGVPGFEKIKPCTAAYTVYVLKDGDSVVGLRFEVIQDQYLDRKEAMTKIKWQPFDK